MKTFHIEMQEATNASTRKMKYFYKWLTFSLFRLVWWFYIASFTTGSISTPSLFVAGSRLGAWLDCCFNGCFYYFRTLTVLNNDVLNIRIWKSEYSHSYIFMKCNPKVFYFHFISMQLQYNCSRVPYYQNAGFQVTPTHQALWNHCTVTAC